MLPFPKSTHEVMVKLAREKAAIDQKIAKIKMEGESCRCVIYAVVRQKS